MHRISRLAQVPQGGRRRSWRSATALSMEGRSIRAGRGRWPDARSPDQLEPLAPSPPAPQPRPHPRTGEGPSRAAPGGLLRHRRSTGPPPWLPMCTRCPASTWMRAFVGTASTGCRSSTSASALQALDPVAAAGRVVIAHLGNGCSMAAVRGGQEPGRHDGLHGAGRPVHGHAVRPDRPRRSDLLDAATGHVASTRWRTCSTTTPA